MLTSEFKEKKITEHYLKTKVFGAYETADILWDEEEAGKYAPCFDDALLVFHPDQTSMERGMVVEGKRFRIHSLFATDADFTSTDKLLELIDYELEKEARTA